MIYVKLLNKFLLPNKDFTVEESNWIQPLQTLISGDVENEKGGMKADNLSMVQMYFKTFQLSGPF